MDSADPKQLTLVNSVFLWVREDRDHEPGIIEVHVDIQAQLRVPCLKRSRVFIWVDRHPVASYEVCGLTVCLNLVNMPLLDLGPVVVERLPRDGEKEESIVVRVLTPKVWICEGHALVWSETFRDVRRSKDAFRITPRPGNRLQKVDDLIDRVNLGDDRWRGRRLDGVR